MEYRTKGSRHLRHAIIFPFIWMLIIPLALLDLFLEIYHRISFPLYGKPLVKRNEYIKIDRQKLSYIKGFDKLSCMYCGYANGLLHYASAIGGETERYWCGIKHQETPGFHPTEAQKNFAKYGDEKDFNRKYPKK